MGCIYGIANAKKEAKMELVRRFFNLTDHRSLNLALDNKGQNSIFFVTNTG